MKVELNDFNSNPRHAEAADNSVIDDFSVTLDNGTEFNVRATNPHGFYRIHLKKGRLPGELEGAYTSAQQAIDHANLLLSKSAKAA